MLPPRPHRLAEPSEAELTRRLRNGVHAFLRALASRELDAALELAESALGKDALEARLKEYLTGHARLRTDPKARVPGLAKITRADGHFRVEQVLADPDDHNDWQAVFTATLTEDFSFRLRLEELGPVG